MPNDPRELSERLGYRFQDVSLLVLALTHGSATGGGQGSNQRLEYLGDAALGLSVCHALYSRLPDVSQGDLTKLKSRYVSNSHLAAVARSLGVGSCLLMSEAESDRGGREKERCLADAMEALVGAVYLDGGMAAVHRIVRRFVVIDQPLSAESSKAALQEWLQSRGRETPHYEVVLEAGPSHNRTYRVEARCRTHVGLGEASRKQAAEELAAADVLTQLADAEIAAARRAGRGSVPASE